MFGGKTGTHQTALNSDFSNVPRVEMPRSKFNRPHDRKMTFNSGDLVPFYCDEVLPGDTVNLSTSLFGRMATPEFPFMDNLHLETFFFFVPNRLLWDNWERMMGAQDDPDDSIDYMVPVVSQDSTAGFARGGLADHFGIPPGVQFQNSADYPSALHFRAYNFIWNEWFRDQNLQDSVFFDTGDGVQSASRYPIQKRGKRHDYFTACLPWPQKGDAVSIPIGQDVLLPVTGLGFDQTNAAQQLPGKDVWETGYQAPSGQNPIFNPSRNYPDAGWAGNDANSASVPGLWARAKQADPNPENPTFSSVWVPDISVDLDTVEAISVNELRRAFQVQRLQERFARGGTRYIEIVRSNFGAVSADSRFQRPEYLGGGKALINKDPIPQTSESGSTDSLGDLGAVATVQAHNHGFTRSFTEHGVILGLVCVYADLTYQQGMHRMWSRRDRFDFAWPALSHIGEQAVLNKEIFLSGDSEKDNQVFGYNERYAEYRYKPNEITGTFRSDHPQSLDNWHIAQDFADTPALNDEFISEDVPLDRVIAVPSATTPQMILDAYTKGTWARVLPMYGVPGMIDRF